MSALFGGLGGRCRFEARRLRWVGLAEGFWSVAEAVWRVLCVACNAAGRC